MLGIQDIRREIRKIAKFIEVDLTEDEIDQIVENTSFANVRKQLSALQEGSALKFNRKGDHCLK